jgi:hypothetical protein
MQALYRTIRRLFHAALTRFSHAGAPNACRQRNLQEETMSMATNAVDVDVRGIDVVKALVVGVPPGAELSAGLRLEDGIWELAPRELYGLRITRPVACDTDIDLAVHVHTTEVCNGSLVECVEILHTRVEVAAALDCISGPDGLHTERTLTFV